MARDPMRAKKVEALDHALRSMFRSLEARALPDDLRADRPCNLIDQMRTVSSDARRRER